MESAGLGRHWSAAAARFRYPRGEGSPLSRAQRAAVRKQRAFFSGELGGRTGGCEPGRFDRAAATLTQESTMNESKLYMLYAAPSR